MLPFHEKIMPVLYTLETIIFYCFKIEIFNDPSNKLQSEPAGLAASWAPPPHPVFQLAQMVVEFV